MATWQIFNNKVCRVYTSGVIKSIVPVLRFKITETIDSYLLSYHFTPRSCLVNKSWQENRFSWSKEFTRAEIQRAVEKQMISLCQTTFSHWN